MLSAGLVALREALRNVVKHASVSSARLSLWTEGSVLVAEVADDGLGFDPDAVDRGYGLIHRLQTGVEAAGGQVEIHSSPGRGTRVRLRLPGSQPDR